MGGEAEEDGGGEEGREGREGHTLTRDGKLGGDEVGGGSSFGFCDGLEDAVFVSLKVQSKLVQRACSQSHHTRIHSGLVTLAKERGGVASEGLVWR